MKTSTKPVTPIDHYWLVAGQVHFTLGDNVGHQHCLNCIIKTDREAFAHVNMGKAQQLLQMRLLNEIIGEQPPEGFKILDVFLMSVSHLGRMTPEEFQEGFAELSTEQSKAEEVLRELRKNGAQTL